MSSRVEMEKGVGKRRDHELKTNLCMHKFVEMNPSTLKKLIKFLKFFVFA